MVDLRGALPLNPYDQEIHRLLAEAYGELGLAEMAAEHRRRATAGPERR